MPLTFLGAEDTFQKWAELDGCTGMPSPVDASGCSRYSSCDDGAEVVLCTDEGVALAGDPVVAWDVLSRHTL
jgi:polyhydroxybutyrate depolymerase